MLKNTGVIRLCMFFTLIHSVLSAQNMDIDLLRDINLNRNRSLDPAFKGFTDSAAPLAYGVPAVLLGIGLLKKDSIAERNALTVGAAVLASSGVTVLLKYGIRRQRPYERYAFIEKKTGGIGPSFPSGHTSESFALATSVSLACPKWWVIAPSFIWAGAVGYSRMHLGVHYPSDVLAGAAIGAGSAYLCRKINRKLNGFIR
jgi:membrane-associated phospholipid phosphatase